MAWSEPLFILLAVPFLLYVDMCFQTRSTLAFISSVVVVALAVLTRYAGVTMVAPGAIALLILEVGNWRRRLYFYFERAALLVDV